MAATLFISAVSGLASGILSFGLIYYLEAGFFLLLFLPGTIFGINIALLYSPKAQSLPFSISRPLWVVGCTLSYVAAISIVLNWGELVLFIFKSQLDLRDYSFISSGVVGAFLMVLCFHFLIHRLKLVYILSLSLLGGLLAVISFLLTFDNEIIPSNSGTFFGTKYLIYIFVYWQTGMTVALTLATLGKPEEQTQPSTNT